MAADDADIVLLHERVLVDRARHGDRAAFAELYRRHAAPCWRVALAVGRDAAAARAAVVDAFARVLSPEARNRPDRTASLRTQLFTATRLAATGSESQPARSLVLTGLAHDDRSASTDKAAAERTSFESLPERWRSVLWASDVEGLDTAGASTVVDLSEDATSLLLERARAGLRERYVQAQLALADDVDCRRTTGRLDAYAAGKLGTRDTSRVRRHLDACDRCRERLLAVDDLLPRLRRAAPLVPILVFSEAEQRWRAAGVAPAGPLHVVLPGGRNAPAWAERALAGAVAAVITLGITGAIIAGGRDKPRDDRLARQTSNGVPAGDGESALGVGDDVPIVLDDDEPPPPLPLGDAAVGDSPSIGTPMVIENAPQQGALPSDQGTRPPPVTDTPLAPNRPSPAPTPQPSPPAGPGPTGPAPMPTPAPSLQVTVEVDDVVGIAVGDECTGVELLGTSLLCEPETAGDGLGLDLGGALLDPVEDLLGL